MNKVLIVGLGLIGGSYAKCFSSNGIKVYAITKDIKDIEYAKSNNIIIDGTVDVTKEFVNKFDRIILCLYPKTMLEWVNNYKDYIKDGAIIADVSGVKSDILYKIQDLLDNKAEFIGSHPMAGKESSGLIESSGDLFKNANYIITPSDKNTVDGIKFSENIGKLIGAKNISTLTPEKHDKMIAFLSQLTHAIAVSLMTSNDDYEDLVLYTGDSFRDLTRIANINENMWSELFILNKNELVNSIDSFTNELIKLRNDILNDNVDNIKESMKKSTYRRKFFNKD